MLDSSSKPRIIRFGIFELDLSAGELRKNGGKVKIQEQPLQVLEMLLEKPGGVVTREDLRQKLWSDNTTVDFDHGLNKAMNKLREALGDSAGSPRFIETLPRRGYRFLTSVEGPPVSLERKPPVPGFPWQAGKAVLALTGAALVALLLVWGLSRLKDSGSSGPAPSQVRSLAVLPLENLSVNGEQDWLADGMTDQLITELGKITALERVISRQSVMRFKGADKSLPEIARELQVDAILEGTVIRVDNQVRISVQLVHASPERSLWAESYERDLGDVLAIQRDVARDVARQINIKLTPNEQARLAGGSPVNPGAFEACLRGRFHWNKRNPEGFRRSIQYFEQALEKDPNHAPAYAGLADSYILLGSYGLLPMHDSYPKAKVAALKALELDDSLAEAHTSLAAVLSDYDWDWAGAERHFRRAIELNPNYPVGHYWFAEYLSRLGRHDEAIEEAQKAILCDPLSSIANTHLGWIYYLSRQYKKSEEQFRHTLELDPDFTPVYWHLGSALIQMGRFEEAVAEFEKGGRIAGKDLLYFSLLGCGYAIEGKPKQARESLNRQEATSSKPYQPSSFYTAAAYANLGEPDQAFEWLERSYRERNAFLGLIQAEPLFDPLRDDPRYRDLIRRMKFPQ